MPNYSSSDIPYEALYELLFPAIGGVQKLIPFIGAGVPISDKPIHEDTHIELEKNKVFKKSLIDYNLSKNAILFLELGFIIATHITSFEKNNKNFFDQENELYKKLIKAEYAPSASELTNLFSHFAHYSSIDEVSSKISKLMNNYINDLRREEITEILKILFKILGINSMPLSSISDYYQTNIGRDELWDKLKRVLENKEKYTLSHKWVATSACDYIKNKPKDHYLILTTNYDCLMEKALDDLNMNYVTLSICADKHNPKLTKVATKFSRNIDKDRYLEREWNKTKVPMEFAFNIEEKVVVIYKIHGSIYPDYKFEDDNIIISDMDYINFISQKSSQHIPSTVTSLIGQKRFMFLGYSLNDWNIRSILKKIFEKRQSEMKDYAILKSYSEFEKLYFERNGINICTVELKEFFSKISEMYDERKKRN